MRLAALAVLPLVFAALERFAAPDAALLDRVWSEHAAGSGIAVDHAAWDGFLDLYAREGEDGVTRLAYGAVTPFDRAALDAYVGSLEAVDPRDLPRDAALAYWINLYNAATVRLVLEHYPLESIREIGSGILEPGPWSREVVTVLGRPLTLDEIEHGIIRPVFEEPRIHYAVNCAALGCPELAREAWRAEGLEARLAEAERDFVNHPRAVRVEEGDLVLSKIWLWFREDFAASEAGLLEGLSGVAEGRAADALAGRDGADRYAYDWALNDVR
jgi:hypothetical protein